MYSSGVREACMQRYGLMVGAIVGLIVKRKSG
jgi:hypothetical protein